MTTDIQLLRSSVARKRPDPAQLLDGQAAINTNAEAPGLFFKLSDGNLTKIGPAQYNTNGNAPNSNPAGSAGNAIGETWLDGRPQYDSPMLKVWNGADWATSSGFTVDDTNGNLSIARALTVTSLTGTGTGNASFIRFPQDTTANRPATPEQGMYRFNTTDNVFEGYNGNEWVRFLQTGGGGGGDLDLTDLTVSGDTTLGSNCGASTLTINSLTQLNCDATFGATTGNNVTFTSRISSDLIPNNTSRDLGSSTLRWAEAWISTLNVGGNSTIGGGCNTTLTLNSFLDANCNATFGNDAGNRVTFNSQISSNFVPDGNATRNLGSTTNRWNNLFIQNLDIAGDFSVGTNCTGTFTVNSQLDVGCSATLGSGAAGQTLTINSAINSNVVPEGNATRSFGSSTARWLAVWTGNLDASGNVALGSSCNTSAVNVNGVLNTNCDTNVLSAATLWNRNELRFSPTATPAAGATYVGFEAPASVTSNVMWTLPDVDGQPGQVLSTNGTGTLSWVNTTTPGADLTVTGNLTVQGSTTLGDSCANDTLTINAVSQFNCNTNIGTNNTTTATIASALVIADNTQILNQRDLRFNTGGAGTNHIGFKAPSTNISANVIWALPNTDGGDGTVLTTNGQGDLSWQAVASNVQPVTVGDVAPTANLTNGQLWWNSSEAANLGSNRLYVYYVDADGGQWVDASPAGAGATDFIFNASLIPTQDNAFDIGSQAFRVRNVFANEIFTGDLHMKNERGDWTLIEEEDFLSIRCNKTGKRFKFLMEQLDD